MVLEPQTGVPRQLRPCTRLATEKAFFASVGAESQRFLSQRSTEGKRRMGRPIPGTPSAANNDAEKWQPNKQHPVYRSSWNAHVLPGEASRITWEADVSKSSDHKKANLATKIFIGLGT